MEGSEKGSLGGTKRVRLVVCVRLRVCREKKCECVKLSTKKKNLYRRNWPFWTKKEGMA